MKIFKYTSYALIFLFSAFYIYGCADNMGSTSFEESVQPYMELQSIPEASNTTITLNTGESKGLDSYFAFDMKNIQRNGMIREGLAEGWCLEWDKPIAHNNDIHTGIEFYSTYGSDTWRPANYLLNIADELRAEDSSTTYREIQVALWSVISEPTFDMHQALRNGDMPPRLMRDGEPNFSISRVEEIVTRVRNEYQNFNYDTGKFIAYANTGNSNQNGGTLVGSETAWALDSNNDRLVTEFCNNSDTQGNNWGWTNGTYAASEASVVLDLYAGAGQCDLEKGIFVGTFTFTYNGSQIDYTIEITEESEFTGDLYEIINYQIHVGSDKLPPSSGTAKYTTAPGSFDYKVEGLSGESKKSGTISGLSGPINVAVHADVSGFKP